MGLTTVEGAQRSPTRPLDRFAWAFVALVALAASLPAIFGDFALDDGLAIHGSACVTGPFRPWFIFTQNFWCGRVLVDSWRPWTVLVWWFLWHVGNGTPLLFHLLGIGLGVLCAVHVLLLTAELGFSRLSGFFAGALFAATPIHAEVTSSCIGVADAWQLLFLLLSVRALLRGQWRAIAFAGLGVLSKETGLVVLPLAILLLTLRQFGFSPESRLKQYALTIGVGAVCAALLVARYFALGAITGQHLLPRENPLMNVSWLARLPTSLALLARYLWLATMGGPLSADYTGGTIPVGENVEWSMVAVGAAAVCGAAMLWRHRDDDRFRLLIAWFAGSYLFIGQVLFLLPALMADRLFFVPSAPLMMLAGVAVGSVATRPAPQRRLVWMGCAIYIATMTALSGRHAWAWTSEDRITATTVEHSPKSARAQMWRARLLAGRGDLSDAADHANRAIELEPNWGAPRAVLASIFDLQGKVDQAEAAFKEGFACDPTNDELKDLYREFRAYHDSKREGEQR